MLDARVALYRTSGGRSDLLTLQDQDNVARLVEATDADALVRELGESARAVVWITWDFWSRLRALRDGRGGRSSGVRTLGEGIVVRDDRIALEAAVEVDALRVLTLAARAAELRLPIDRDALARIGDLSGRRVDACRP